MKVDRDKCVEAGASDYIAKPLDTDQLLSMLRVWLGRRQWDVGGGEWEVGSGK
jgi:CheY-like chemotaxis protein